MKAIVLTYADITPQEAKLLKNTDVFKIATNYCRAELNPNVRLTADDIVDKCLDCDTCDVVSLNYDYEKDRVICGSYLPNRNTSLVSCCDYLYMNGYTSILLVATNKITNNKEISDAFQKLNKSGINSLKNSAYIYKYRDDAVFDVPTMSIKEFINMDEEENTKTLPLLSILAFSDSYLYEVSTKGLENKSIENGLLVGSILTDEAKKKILAGVEKIEENGLVITRLTGRISKDLQ